MRVACILFSEILAESKLVEFAEACLRFSPQIAIRTSNSPHALFIEIGKCQALYSEASFQARTHVLLKRFNLSGKIAFSSDIPSSLALAKYQTQNLNSLPIESLDCFIDPLATESPDLKLVLSMIHSFKRLGIHTLGHFKSIPSSSLPSRFGSLGLYCRQRLENTIPMVWPYWKPAEKFSERIELNPSEYCSDIEPLLFKAKELFDRIFSRLRGHFLRAERIQFLIELERYSTVKTPIREWVFDLISPQGSTLGFLPILKERLYRDLSQNPIESYAIAIQAFVLSSTPSLSVQNKMWEKRNIQDYEEAMGSLFGQLEEYLGKGHVFWAKTTEERFPERSWVKTKNKNKNENNAKIQDQYPLRPTRIFKSPIPVTIIQNRILIKRKTFKSIKWSSIERLSLDWLNESSSRNYYRVEIEGNKILWIFSDPKHSFFLHGYFE